jgi:F420-dependent oxidoreductase-like protein
MRIGVMAEFGWAPMASLDPLVERARELERLGFAGFWLPHIFGIDAMTALAVVGRETRRIELGTAVVPSYPRHPAALAQQALTVQTASAGRFALGIGLSHKMVIEGMFGLSYAQPARHMRSYLEVLAPLVRGQAAPQGGEFAFRGALQFQTPPVPILVAALGPVMLRIAGELADGTLTWMTGLRTLETHTIPRIREAAKAAGRPEPRIAAGLPIRLASDVPAAREKLGRALQMYGTIPSYRAMLDREGAASPADVAVLGDERALRAALARLRSIGVTDFIASGPDRATLELLQSEL